MGTITARQRKNGSTAFLAQIVVKRAGHIIHRENKTFDSRKRAAAWLAQRENEIDESAPGADPFNPDLAAIITRYMNESARNIGRTKKQVLEALKAMPVSSLLASEITSRELVALAKSLNSAGRKPQTVGNYLSHLASVFAIAGPAWGYKLNQQAMLDALKVCKRLGYTRKSEQRERRPTGDEIKRLVAHFDKVRANRPASVPMSDIVMFAIHSTRRLDEITRLQWRDLNRERSRVMVRDMKHPGDKIGNNQWVELVPDAMLIIERQPRQSERIFPCSTDAIGAAFTRACKVLDIHDLHFHDLRHEGISRLFEQGWTIPQVACVSGHRSWQSLKRYTHLT